jgi:ketosteroid isomerase-like protein
MDNNIEVLKRMYASFNARDIDGVLAQLADDVTWANGMDGGYVHGHEAVREYWTRQWSIVSPLVEPKQFKKVTEDLIIVDVQQSIRDLEGKPLQDQTHGLHDKLVGHVFHFQAGKVVRFEIQDVPS